MAKDDWDWDADEWDTQAIMYMAFGIFGGLIVFFSICCACCNRRRKSQSKLNVPLDANTHSNTVDHPTQSNDVPDDGKCNVQRLNVFFCYFLKVFK